MFIEVVQSRIHKVTNNRFRLHKSQTEQSCALLKEESGQLAHFLRMNLLPADPSHFQHLLRPATHFGLPVTHSLLLSVSTVGEDVNPSSASEATALSVIRASVLALQAFDIGSNVSPGRKQAHRQNEKGTHQVTPA